ncbi:MAG: serpin family protein [Eubacteriales bacterium]|nr:serpin family protein [Eubacteriales bacterium]
MKLKKRFIVLSFLFVACFALMHSNAASAATKKPTLNKTKITTTVGKQVTLKVKNTKKKFRWYTKNKKVVTVTSKGVITAKKKGSTKIVAKNGKTRLVCSVTVKDIPAVPTTNIKPSVSRQVADFSVSMLQKSTKDDLQSKKNIMVSPYSISLAMLMMTNGAKEETLKQLESALCGDYDLNTVNQYMSALNKDLTASKTGKTTFHSANSIWMNQELGALNPAFVEQNQNLFQAIAYDRTFDEATCAEINDWIAKNTKDMIKNPLQRLSSDDATILVNALAFEGNWLEKYNSQDIKKGETFTREDGTKEKATMMYETTKNNYFEDQNVSGFVKAYQDGYSFMAILPKNGKSVEQCISSLTGEKLMQYYQNHTKTPKGYEYIVHTKLPQFSFDYDGAKVIDALKEMGVINAFDEVSADFGNMATMNHSSSNIYIGDIVHKTHIELDENGTRAAAATIVISKATAMPNKNVMVEKYVYLDRPFVFVIMDNEHNTPLFIGAVHSVTNK